MGMLYCFDAFPYTFKPRLRLLSVLPCAGVMRTWIGGFCLHRPLALWNHGCYEQCKLSKSVHGILQVLVPAAWSLAARVTADTNAMIPPAPCVRIAFRPRCA